MTAHLGHTGFKGNTGTKGGLLKEHEKSFSVEAVLELFGVSLEVNGALDNLANFVLEKRMNGMTCSEMVGTNC